MKEKERENEGARERGRERARDGGWNDDGLSTDKTAELQQKRANTPLDTFLIMSLSYSYLRLSYCNLINVHASA